MSDLQQKMVWAWPEGSTTPVHAGTFSLDARKGPLGRFHYETAYLQQAQTYALDPLALPLLPARPDAEFTNTLNGGLFGAFRDVCPEGYGRDLLNHRYGREDGGGLTPMELLEYSVGDGVGAIEVCDDIGQKQRFQPPPAQQLLELLGLLEPARPASHAVHQLLELGTSMGGERPKLTVKSADALWLAKLQDRGDAPHVPAREYVAMKLARECDIRTADIEFQRAANGREILLVRRFDRVGLTGARLAYLSAHTLLRLDLGSTPGDRQRSYPIMADRARRLGVPKEQIAELWRRMAFNSLVNNVDDHPRNHGFIHVAGQWTLAPAFDIVPLLTDSNADGPVLAMAVTTSGQCQASVDGMLESASQFGLSPREAATILLSMAEIVTRRWRGYMEDLGVSHAFLDRQKQSFLYAEAIGAQPDEVLRRADQASKQGRRRARSTRPQYWMRRS
ncbi:type II toxin-antitoxin system HipA family toxin [Bordetella sp. N]|uniref:type II toxin-antitoxin system HipA family toxin n=1 Tax=Bordetella sp. N TaxID=1746199 RepID=UPI00070C008C|nr:HipA domain-containing protein [Bordetella sp. N]ALM82116.1 hypothetical protein ASB57_03290 [Bordetella sp. N]